jgi:MFS family permease
MQGAGEAERPLHRQREYMLLWGSQVVSNFGAHASGIIYPLLILALTGSPAQASWATALRIVPYLLLSLPVGALIDRWDRRRVMLACHVGRAAVVASLPVAMVAGVLTVQQIYVVAVLEGVLMVFFNIAETAALPRVVPLVQLPQATAQNQAGFAAASIAGPALGKLHDLPLAVTSFVVTGFMLCGAAGMVVGGFLAARGERLERTIAACLLGAALLLFLASLPALPPKADTE